MDREEAIKRVKALNLNSKDMEALSTLVPEIVESEDEKIRKALVDTFKFYDPTMNSPYLYLLGIDKKDVLAWLEKQGRLMKALQISNARIGKLIEKNYYLKEQIEKQGEHDMGISEATKKKLEDNLNKALEKETPESWNEFIEKQGEQKPTDKVIQKFKVGDWVVFKDKHESIYQVEKIKEGYYILRHTYGGTFRVCVLHDEDLRLWTIQDAKDGDVLTLISGQSIFLFDGYDKEYCHYSKLTNTFSPNFNYIGFIQHQFVPATKEQRDLLFQKMQEAGYEWDANKKELKNY